MKPPHSHNSQALSAMWRVEVVSHENIKPSSPTPPHLRFHKLSWIDKMAPPFHFSVVLFYTDPPADAAETLKNSLAETLTIFHPLAGRLDFADVDNASTVDCSDQGVDFFEARAVADSPLSELIDRCVDRSDLNALIPFATEPQPSLLAVQATSFAPCGGMALAASFYHTLADGQSASDFIAAWTGRATPRPIFDVARRFGPPPRTGSVCRPASDRSEKLVTKRFVFEERAVDALRERRRPGRTPPSRVVAVSALLWRCMVRARSALVGNWRFGTTALVTVNMRGKERLPEELFGNVYDIVAVGAEAEAIGAGDGFASEEKLRRAIGMTDGERVRRLRGEEGALEVLGSYERATREAERYGGGGGEVVRYFMSSWSRFPLYEADFGWGKPAWVAPAGRMFQMRYGALLVGRGGSRGLEAWVKLEKKEMEEFERDEELLSFSRK